MQSQVPKDQKMTGLSSMRLMISWRCMSGSSWQNKDKTKIAVRTLWKENIIIHQFVREEYPLMIMTDTMMMLFPMTKDG